MVFEYYCTKDKIDEIIEISVGINSVETPSSYDFILNVLFENKDDLDSYIVNKYHKEVGTFVREVVDKRVSIDYEV
ncbi:MAG: Dabb family protein [Ruminococcaceae bacterium]|nr:Dabb family protein [Oscillospiraceae bacterium]